jgi:PAS domain S-box-containing protein
LDKAIFEILVEQVREYAVFVLDTEGRIQTWNTGARVLKGYERDEIVGRHFSIFYTPDAIAADWPAHELKVATMEGRFEDEGWRLRKDGSRFWANVIISALRADDGQLLGFSKITRDLTSRRESEEALRQSEERFRLLIEGVTDYAVFMLDPDGVVSSWNSGAQNIKGYSPEEIIGKHFSQFYLPEDIEAARPWQELALARKEGRAEDEGWRLRKNGEKFWARVVVSSVYDTAGRLVGFAKVTQDLSQREHARELENAAQRIHEFIGMLAHELRNPLAPIRNAVELMGRLPPDDPAQSALRETMDRQSAHLSRILDDMLDVARITRGKLSIERRPVELAEVVSRALEVAGPSINAAGHTLDVEVPPDSLLVHGDLNRLTQAVGNLLTNAARFTACGGRISVKVHKDGDQIRLSVRDNGRGIASEDLDKIFGMFIQGKEPLNRVDGGLGIGLALARSIVELHGGAIEAKSEGEGRGSEFTLRLPAAPVPAQPSEPAPSMQTLPQKAPAKRVLVVDDNVDAADTLGMLMRSLGHEAKVVYDGMQALQAAEEFRPDVVLLDIGLPGINGYEVARRLRSRKGGQSAKIIAITGWGQDADRARAREAGFDVHLVKPVNEAALQHLVEANGNPGSIH